MASWKLDIIQNGPAGKPASWKLDKLETSGQLEAGIFWPDTRAGIYWPVRQAGIF